jgi:hypothetical protein
MPTRRKSPTVASIAFNENTVTPLLLGGGEIDCPRMMLTCAYPDLPVYSGPGFLRCDEAGHLHFKIYPTESADPNFGFDWLRTSVPGQLLDRQLFYSLSATDFVGQAWKSEGILPGTTRGPGGQSVHGTLRDLRSSKTMQYAQDGSCLKMLFFDDVEIPCNATVDTTMNFGEESQLTARSLNLARFNSCGFEFLLHTDPGRLQAVVTSNEGIPEQLEMRFIESLQFSLAKSLQCRFFERVSGQTNTIRLMPARPQSSHTKLPPPLRLNAPEVHGNPNPVWNMLDRYLQFILPYGEPDWHPCSIYVHKAREASSNSLDARALALTIAVEGPVKRLHPDIEKPSNAFKKAVRCLKAHCASWAGVDGWDGNDSLRQRAGGLLSQLWSTRPVDRLYALADCGTVDRPHIEAWKALRNPMAHAEIPDPADSQLFVDNLMAATVLLHQLVFSTIRYVGPYTDYSTRGFPTRHYAGGT